MKELIDIKNEFYTIFKLRSNIKNKFEIIKSKHDMLHKIYLSLIKNYKNPINYFGIDAFYFQNKIILLERDELQNQFKSINNRMYCEYYKLHKYIHNYIKVDLSKDKIGENVQTKTYPPYKNLEPFKEYSTKHVIDMQNSIVCVIMELQSHLMRTESELNTKIAQSDKGLHIDNLIHSQEYLNTLVKEKTKMFLNFLDTFNIHQLKYYNRLYKKLVNLLESIDEDIILIQYNDEMINHSFTKKLMDENVKIGGANVKSITDSSMSVINKEVGHSQPIRDDTETKTEIENFVSEILNTAISSVQNHLPEKKQEEDVSERVNEEEQEKEQLGNTEPQEEFQEQKKRRKRNRKKHKKKDINKLK